MMTKIYKYRLKKKEEGQSIIEFVLVLPIFAIILFSILDYGWLFVNYIEVENSARNAARIACVEYTNVNMVNGQVQSPVDYTLDALNDDTTPEQIVHILSQVKNSLPKKVDNVKVTITYTNDLDAVAANRNVKNRYNGDVKLVVSCRIATLTPVLGSGADKMHRTLTSTSIFKVEKSDDV